MNVSLSTVSIGSLFDDLINVAVRNKMRIPASMLFVSKALVAVEGTTKKVDPTFDIVTNSTEFAQTLVVKKKFEPKKLVADTVSFVSGISGLIQSLPKQLQKIISMTEKQKLGMQISLVGSADFDRYITCISLSLISTGLSVGSSLVIQAKIAPMIWGVSFLGIFGYAVAVILGLWVVFLASKKNK
jgi:ubiquinone biosynthesis protein